jgi:asparagine synthase (glutamine-hydrolysing)
MVAQISPERNDHVGKESRNGMCGLNGIYAFSRSANSPDKRELIATRDAMAARGPDGIGEWWSNDKRVGMGHRRLSIIDLSDRASQPMTSTCGRYVVVFNGEIYNYQSLREELKLKGCRFNTQSDTEVLLHLYDLFQADMVGKLRGMFAFAIWDNVKRSLFLARDPYGIKPLYTANDGWTFRWASQVKALLAGQYVSRVPEPAGVVGFHIWGFVPEPFTLYRDIRALPAGHTQLIDETGPQAPQPYASIAQIFSSGSDNRVSQDQVSSRVREAMLDSVTAHLHSDVEVGIFLSGGVDSAALLGLMRDAGQKQIRAVTLSFGEYHNTHDDEVPLASTIARQYEAEHIVRKVDQQEFLSDLPSILEAMDQPSIDGINTWFAAKAVRELGIKVAVSGVGGDEILAGYPSFSQIPRMVSLLRGMALMPGVGAAARNLIKMSKAIKNIPKSSSLFEYGGTYPGAYLLRRGLFLPHELDGVLDGEFLVGGLQRLSVFDGIRNSMTPVSKSPTSKVAVLESCLYLRNQLLRDADWAGMANSVEIRTPFVDINLAQSLSVVTPSFSGNSGKVALAAAPTAPLPKVIVERQKSGFTTPLSQWIANRPLSTGEIGCKGSNARYWARTLIENESFFYDA